MMKISILIAGDHKLIRDTFSYFLNDDPRFNVIAACGDAMEAVELAREKKPSIILMDINMTPFSGIEATQKILKISPGSMIIGVSMHSQPAYAIKMMQIGAKGYVTKNSSMEEMVKAILEVNKGNKYICDEIKNSITGRLFEDIPYASNINTLTKREMEIINLIKEGSSSKKIAANLQLSIHTVEMHRHNILKKLKLKNSVSLINFIHNNSSYI
jgi:DNA-binding NarL/FixJ family response regulator